MAELVAGFVSTAETFGAATLATGSGFTGRHESSHREEMLETRSMDDFMQNRQSGEVTPDEQVKLLKARDEAIRRENEYRESIESYKDASWFEPLKKLKKMKDVSRANRLTRQSNQLLKKQYESPGSNLTVDDLRDWRFDVFAANDHNSPPRDESPQRRRDDSPPLPALPLEDSWFDFFGPHGVVHDAADRHQQQAPGLATSIGQGPPTSSLAPHESPANLTT
ncbi:hypothetical protein C8R44DRAFT_904583 [Mycena epipterygia]|nr:hypothetical protein C8R44DRAFT_904583 [Mycena epipterygia]